jgi:hypothetical protein
MKSFIMGIIAALHNPISLHASDLLFCLGLGEIGIKSEDTVKAFQSFLHTDDSGVLWPVHNSFVEFLAEKGHCQDNRVFLDLNICYRQLTDGYLSHMQTP